jgi:hypothetical protein
MPPPSYPYCDDPASSLLRLVLISEILCAEETVRARLADVWQESGLLASADAPPVWSPPDMLPLLRPVHHECSVSKAADTALPSTYHLLADCDLCASYQHVARALLAL